LGLRGDDDRWLVGQTVACDDTDYGLCYSTSTVDFILPFPYSPSHLSQHLRIAIRLRITFMTGFISTFFFTTLVHGYPAPHNNIFPRRACAYLTPQRLFMTTAPRPWRTMAHTPSVQRLRIPLRVHFWIRLEPLDALFGSAYNLDGCALSPPFDDGTRLMPRRWLAMVTLTLHDALIWLRFTGSRFGRVDCLSPFRFLVLVWFFFVAFLSRFLLCILSHSIVSTSNTSASIALSYSLFPIPFIITYNLSKFSRKKYLNQIKK